MNSIQVAPEAHVGAGKISSFKQTTFNLPSLTPHSSQHTPHSTLHTPPKSVQFTNGLLDAADGFLELFFGGGVGQAHAVVVAESIT